MNQNMETAEDDFVKAKRHADFEHIFSRIKWKNPDLIPMYQVTDLIKPQSECYIGIKPIKVNKIVGSESRYDDFSAEFYPKAYHLKRRWTSIDYARLENIELPPISVFKIGDVYFVRDGNHRVSVAKAKGQEFIDAEIVELTINIKLEEGMTLNEIKKRVVDYEREEFIKQYNPTYLPMYRIKFTIPGSYAQLINHILVHKYYMNLNVDHELSFKDAALDWQYKVYTPIILIIRKYHMLREYPGLTESDLYLWVIQRWDAMKRSNSQASRDEAAQDLLKEDTTLHRWLSYLKSKFSHS